MITERERRYAVAYVEASVELSYDDAETAMLAYFRAFPAAVVDAKDAKRLSKFLLRRPAVQRLIATLRVELSTRAMVPVSRVVEELTRIGLSNFADYGRIDAKGQFQVDLSRASYRSLAGINEIEVKERVVKVHTTNPRAVREDDADPEVETVVQRTTKIKLQKMEALDRLAKIHGLFTDGNMDPQTALEFVERAMNRMQSKPPVQIDQVPA